jgi:hypothetical protein
MLNGVAGANLIRRQRIAMIAGQAFNIGAQLARVRRTLSWCRTWRRSSV